MVISIFVFNFRKKQNTQINCRPQLVIIAKVSETLVSRAPSQTDPINKLKPSVSDSLVLSPEPLLC